MSAAKGRLRLAEAVYRCEAHCLVCSELYGSGRAADALLQAARPMTDLFPWLETELRALETEFRAFMTAVTAMGGHIRQTAKPRALRRALKEVIEARKKLIRAMFGDETDPAVLNASIALALLDTLRASYAQAVEDQDLAAYQTSYGLAETATDLLASAAQGAYVDLPSISLLSVALPGAVPPTQLVRPEQMGAVIEAITREVQQRMRISAAPITIEEQLAELDRLLADVLGSYERGEGPLAARLAASLFLRSYDPIREELARVAPSSEENLTRLLAFELRRAINDRVPAEQVAELGDQIRVHLSLTEDAERQSTEPALERSIAI